MGPDESVRTPRVVRPNLTQALQSFETGGARALESGFADAGNPAGMALLRAVVVREIQALSAERRSASVAVGANSTGEARELPIGGTIGTREGQRGLVGTVHITMDEYGFVHVTTHQMPLGERTLYVRLGRYTAEQRRRETAADTELQTGALLDHLAQLQGRR